MNILITGYNGFIGSNLTKALNGNHLIGVDQFEGDTVHKHFNWGDLDKIGKVDSMIHLAGKAHDTQNTSNALEYLKVNVGLTKEIFKRFLESEAKIFIFFSSVKAVADNVLNEYLTESTIPDPQTPYGISKLEAEGYILKQVLPAGKKVFILRPCMIHGPGNKGNLNLLYKISQKGWPWPLGAFENRRSFTSIENLLFVIQSLILLDVEPGTYQIADDESLSTNQLIRLMGDSLNKKARILKISPGLIRFMAKTGDKFDLPLNSERLKKLTESYVVSNEKIKRALGIDKMPVRAEEGMKRTLGSFIIH